MRRPCIMPAGHRARRLARMVSRRAAIRAARHVEHRPKSYEKPKRSRRANFALRAPECAFLKWTIRSVVLRKTAYDRLCAAQMRGVFSQRLGGYAPPTFPLPKIIGEHVGYVVGSPSNIRLSGCTLPAKQDLATLCGAKALDLSERTAPALRSLQARRFSDEDSPCVAGCGHDGCTSRSHAP